MNNFKIGDFIRIKNVASYRIDRISGGEINIFEISNISSNYVEIYNCKESIPFSEIEPIPINGIADFQIYYDPIIAVSFIEDGASIPIKQTERLYYLEAFKKHEYKDKNLKELVKEKNFEYVHDIQNFLQHEFKKSDLRIDVI